MCPEMETTFGYQCESGSQTSVKFFKPHTKCYHLYIGTCRKHPVERGVCCVYINHILTSRNCTSPNSPSSDTQAYAASLCRKSWHKVISSLLNNEPILIFFPWHYTKKYIKWGAPSLESASRLRRRRNRIKWQNQ